MNLAQQIQAAVIEHRERRDEHGACVGCACGEAWSGDEALTAYGLHLAVVLVDVLALTPGEPWPLVAAREFERRGAPREHVR